MKKSSHKEKSCGAVLFRIDNGTPLFLLVRHLDGHWSFPKGHMKKHETHHETAFREIREETGLSAAFVDGFVRKTHYSPAADVRKTVVWYLAVPYDGNQQMQEDELSDMKWAETEEALNIITYENDRILLKEALHFLGGRKQQ